VQDGFGGSVAQNMRLPGQYGDLDYSGINYNINRDYYAYWGRYMEADPIGLRGGMNPYSYAQANPLRFSDHTGLYSWSDFRNMVIGFMSLFSATFQPPDPTSFLPPQGPTNIEDTSKAAAEESEDESLAATQGRGQSQQCPMSGPPAGGPPVIPFFLSTPPSLPWFYIGPMPDFIERLLGLGGGDQAI
jgi:RHS repeat-associated protein